VVSIYPCSVHGQRVTGPLHGLRVTTLRGDDKHTRYLRVCSADLPEISRQLEEWSALVDDEGLAPAGAVCGARGHDGKEVPANSHVFAYVYERGHDPQQRYGQLCDSCYRAVINIMGLTRESK